MSTQGSSVSPAGAWYADPTGRHQHRYWNGSSWTSDVADYGRASIDPLEWYAKRMAAKSDAVAGSSRRRDRRWWSTPETGIPAPVPSRPGDRYPPPPSFDDLVTAGDAAVGGVVDATMQAADRVSRGGEGRLESLFTMRDLMTVLGRIDTASSRSELVGFLTRAYPQDETYPGESDHPYTCTVHSYAIDALDECRGGADPAVLSGLLRAAAELTARTGSWDHTADSDLPKLYVLARRFGGRIPLPPEMAVKMISNSGGDEGRLGIAYDYKDEIPAWPSGLQCSFWWFYGVQVANARGDAQAMPFFAASLLANPSPDAAAWGKFSGVARSPGEAKRLARQYPLPDAFHPGPPRRA